MVYPFDVMDKSGAQSIGMVSHRLVGLRMDGKDRNGYSGQVRKSLIFQNPYIGIPTLQLAEHKTQALGINKTMSQSKHPI